MKTDDAIYENLSPSTLFVLSEILEGIQQLKRELVDIRLLLDMEEMEAMTDD